MVLLNTCVSKEGSLNNDLSVRDIAVYCVLHNRGMSRTNGLMFASVWQYTSLCASY